LILVGLCALAIGLLRAPEREISRTELEALIQTKGISKGRVMPTPYAGIYHIEGTRNVGGKSEKFFVTTHLGETEIKSLIDQNAVKTEIPGLGMSGQWVNIVSVLLIAGVAITLVVCQANIGRGKNASVKQRPTVTFRDVAGIEEAKSEVQEIVDFLRDPKKYERLGGTLPK